MKKLRRFSMQVGAISLCFGLAIFLNIADLFEQKLGNKKKGTVKK